MGVKNRQRIVEIKTQILALTLELDDLKRKELHELASDNLIREEVAYILDCTAAQVTEFVKKGLIPKGVRFGGSKTYYSKQAVEEFKKRRPDPFDGPKMNMHLTEEDLAVPSSWWEQARRVAENIRTKGVK